MATHQRQRWMSPTDLEAATVVLMGASNAQSERFGPARNHQKVYMIRHETVADKIDVALSKVRRLQFEAKLPVLIRKEDGAR